MASSVRRSVAVACDGLAGSRFLSAAPISSPASPDAQRGSRPDNAGSIAERDRVVAPLYLLARVEGQGDEPGCVQRPVLACGRGRRVRRPVSAVDQARERSLRALRPEHVAQLHPTRNAELDPFSVGAWGQQKLLGRCGRCGTKGGKRGVKSRPQDRMATLRHQKRVEDL